MQALSSHLNDLYANESGANELQQNISFAGSTCSDGHELSSGSVSGHEDITAKNVIIIASTITDSTRSVCIKTAYEAIDSVSDVTLSNITISDITDYGIIIGQDSEYSSPTGTPTSSFPITDLTIQRISGSVKSVAVEVCTLCGDDACSDWTWSELPVERRAANPSRSRRASCAKKDQERWREYNFFLVEFRARFSLGYFVDCRFGQYSS
ncbi:hypothetical protein F1880_003140 [Penicillium rolfsii]|nr:hypothetical protein F1880_003140 [Penicillium rolfsii]